MPSNNPAPVRKRNQQTAHTTTSAFLERGRKEGASSPDKCRDCRLLKAKGKDCVPCSKKESDKEDSDERAWVQRYVQIQLGIVRELEKKTGKSHEDVKKQLERGSAQDIMEAQVKIQQEIQRMNRG